MAAPHQPATLLDLDALLDAILAVSPAEQAAALERACAERPQLADALRRRYASLQSLGLLEAPLDVEQLPVQLGEFVLLERLGGGGMGVVYRARQEPIGRLVALKLVRPELTLFGASRLRFQREAEAIARLDHPGIVPLYTFGEARGVPYLAMQLVEGCSLTELLQSVWGRRVDRLTASDLGMALRELAGVAAVPDWCAPSWPRAVVRLTLQVAQALAHAHARGVVHRDVKPSNIMLARDGRVMLLDFGLALAEGEASITRPGTAMGSFGYAPPEQLAGQEVDARADVFSLGAVLYELLSLRAPFASDDPRAAAAHAPLREPLPLPRRAGVGADLAAIVHKAIERPRAARYASMAAFAGDLRAWLDNLPLSVRPDTAPRRVLRFVRREPLRAGLYASLTAAIVAVAVGGGYWLANRAAVDAGRNKLAADAAERWLAAGVLELRAGHRAAAEALFVRARHVDPGSEAAAALQQLHAPVAELDPNTASPPTLFAAALASLWSVRESVVEPRQALRAVICAKDRAPRARLGYHVVWAQAAALAKDEAAARDAVAALAHLWPDEPLAACAIGQALLDLDRPAAVTALRRALQLAPGQPEVRAVLAAALAGCGLWAEAAPLLREVLAQRPDDVFSRINLGIACEQLGDRAAALRELRGAVAAGPGHPGARFNLGRVLIASGDAAAGATELAHALRLEPRYAEARHDLGLLAVDQGQHDEARVHLVALTELRPDWPDSWRALGYAQAAAGDAAGAVASHQRLLQLAPDDGDAHEYLCALLSAQGDAAGLARERARWAARTAARGAGQ